MRFVLFWVAVAASAADGVAPVADAWESIGPFGGPAGLISIDQQNSRRLIASSRNGNIFLTLNGGRAWTRLPFPRIPGGSIEALKIHPSNSNLFLAGVADETRDYAGLYESRDGGKTWERAKEMKDEAVFSLAFFLDNPSVIAAGTRRGVFLSNDTGKTWRRIQRDGEPGPAPVMSLAFDPKDPAVIYAGTTHLPWKTSDGGVNWKSIHDGMLDDSDVFSIHVDSKAPERVYASACSGIYASETGGEQWRRAQGIPGSDRRTHVVTEDPDYSSLIYAGTTAGLWKSSDAGHGWRKLNSYIVRSVEIDPRDGRIMYLATQDRGLLKSYIAGLGFQEINQGFVGRPVQKLLFAGQSIVAVVLRTNGTAGLYRSKDRGMTWHADEDIAGDATIFRGDLYIRNAKGVVREDSAGERKRVEIPGNAEVRALEAGSHLWAVTANGLLKSSDGIRWSRATLPDKSAVYEIYPGERSVAIRTAKGIWLSIDQGTRWTPITQPPGARIFQVALHPRDVSVIFSATASGLMRSKDSGKSWTKVESGLLPGFMYAIASDPDQSGRWFVSQMGKIFQSEDDGETWRLLDGEIDTALVKHLYLPRGSRQIFAVTEAQGIFVRQNLPIIRALGGEN